MLVLMTLTVSIGSASASERSRHSRHYKFEAYDEVVYPDDGFYTQDESNQYSQESYNPEQSDYAKPKVLSVSAGMPGTGHRFPFGQCTWYVATKKYIPWGGNAGTWLWKARNMGYPTGQEPKKGSVAVFGGGPFGHVAVVEGVDSRHITISEMNYTRGAGRMDYRNVSVHDPKLMGFIY
jgi:surface antigen